nr:MULTISPECIES: FHA domain-containing protein [Helcobacillus]
MEIDGQQYLLTGPVTVLGRGGDSDIILDDTGVSRHHLELRVDRGTMTATDLGSTNGTYVNGERVTTPTPLPDGATIRIGRTRLSVILPQSTTEW